MKPQRIEISYKTIIFTIGLILGLGLLWKIRDVLLLFLISLIFMEVLNPAVSRLEKLKIPRVLGIMIIYVIVTVVFSFAIAGMVPALISQISELLQILPSTLENIDIMGFSAIDLSSQLRILESVPSEITHTVFSLFSNLLSGFLIMVITFYLLLERTRLSHYSSMAFSSKGQKIVSDIFEHLELRLGSWVNGQLILMASIGFLSYAGYALLGIPYALPLALIAGLLEVVPTVGPIVATVVAALVAFPVSPLTALLAVVWGIVVQQLENNFIVPKIMSATVGIHPIVTILVIAVGATFSGVGGAVLAIPIYLTIETIIHITLKHRK